MPMERLCTPWRFQYVTGNKKEEGCVFCNRLDCDSAQHFVLHRGEHWYLILNLYPYNSGHLLLVSNRHQPLLSGCSAEELAEMGILLKVMEMALREVFAPDGINCGYNGGQSAGAGIPEHLHVHMLPRWGGDTNFMTTIGETRIMPQTLDQVYGKLLPVIRRLVGEG
ncbi:HIT family hydrolase [bacterium DOLJORAL78_65_58]|nr:MAG: HIT family hydrolase [bacterium DOLZORAL124_64_63]PIE75727.1 MAG: HIT family hydrolase [bacterium DOLJORAL78_65_58]